MKPTSDPPVKQVETGARAPSGQFQKGVSGNPAGRPPAGRSLAEKIRAMDGWDEALLTIMEQAKQGELHAARFLAEFGFGRATYDYELALAEFTESAKQQETENAELREQVRQLQAEVPNESK